MVYAYPPARAAMGKNNEASKIALDRRATKITNEAEDVDLKEEDSSEGSGFPSKSVSKLPDQGDPSVEKPGENSIAKTEVVGGGKNSQCCSIF